MLSPGTKRVVTLTINHEKPARYRIAMRAGVGDETDLPVIDMYYFDGAPETMSLANVATMVSAAMGAMAVGILGDEAED